MTTNPASSGEVEDTATGVSVPILVGVVGKRRSRLDKLRVSEDSVRQKLQAAFDSLETLTPNSPKLLLCGMADGVDEIAARLVIGTVGESRRRFSNWSVVGLLPMPEQVFVDDFAADQGQPWWYHTLDDKQRRHIRVISLQTLPRPAAPDRSRVLCTAEELRRTPDQTNPMRTAHYEQLALVMAERSTVFIAVMPEDETPERLGGTAQAVAHRLNGWRPDWPPPNSVAIAEASDEFVLPPPLAKATSGDVWLVPIGPEHDKADQPSFGILRRREETEPAWPAPIEAEPHHRGKVFNRAVARVSHTKAFMRSVSQSGAGRVARAIDALNHRVAAVESRNPPRWDTSIDDHPAEPEKWSPIAVAELIRGTLSDVQVINKKKIRDTAALLGLLAWFSIACLEIGIEPHSGSLFSFVVGVLSPMLYILSVVTIILVLQIVRWRALTTIVEDYRMVAEALRVQIVWWQFGLIARKEWVDQHIFRYDAREFQLIRQTLASLLDALKFRHSALPVTEPGRHLPEAIEAWIGTGAPKLSGQLGYQNKTAKSRKHTYEWLEFWVWFCFAVAIAMAFWLAVHAAHELMSEYQFMGMNLSWLNVFPRAIGWLTVVGLFLAAIFSMSAAAQGRSEMAAEGYTIQRLWHSAIPGMALGAGVVTAWDLAGFDAGLLHKMLGTGALLFLAAAGAIKYAAEKIDVEAEAQNAAEASIIYARARRVLDEIERDLDLKTVDVAEANRRRERVIRDLGLYALAETEAWLRSHRERPLHPPVG
jgi:hypothetical protein